MLFGSLVFADNLQHIKKELADIDTEVRTALLKGDYDTQLKYYANNAIILPPFYPMVKGKSELKQLVEEDKRQGTVFHAFDGTATDLWTCGKKVYEKGTFSVSLSNKHDNKPKVLNASYFTIWERQDNGELLIVYYMWNLDHPL